MAYDPNKGGKFFPTTGTPAATVGENNDYAVDLTTAGGPFIYGPKANNVWPAAVGLGGSAGTPGNLYAPLLKSANTSIVANDLTGPTPVYVFDCSGADLTFNVDASLLWNAATSQSKVVVLKRSDATTKKLTLTAASGQTIDGDNSVVLPVSKLARRLFAVNATTLYLE